mmetsp:Transcript_26597/g.73039  ORF Transcript_26597/g.73039 Transcript_26597/m.73039 type:complete len:248 (-) Transcript_26597:4568-5311(-)
MVTPAAIGVQRACKLRLRGQQHAVPDALRLHLSHEAAQRLVDLAEFRGKALLEVAVHVPTAGGDEEEVTLRTAALSRTNQLGHLLQLPVQVRGCRVVCRQLRAVQDPPQVLRALDGVQEGACVRLGIGAPMPQRCDVADDRPPALVLVEPDAPALIHDLALRLSALWPDRGACQRKRGCLEVLRAQSEHVSHAATCTTRRGAEILASQRLGGILLIRMREESEATLRLALLELLQACRLRERPDIAD